MRKFISDDDGIDYLESLTQGNNTSNGASITKNPTRKNSTSSRKIRGIPEGDNSIRNSKHRRPIVPPTRSPKDKSPKMRSKRGVYEGSLNDDKPRESTKGLMQSARKLIETAKRAASPGRLRRDRTQSPGPMKNRKSTQNRSRSPTSSSTDPSSKRLLAEKKERPKSPGRLKKNQTRENSGENENSTRSKRRTESPGRLAKRSQSPGRMKKRSQSPGALRKTARPRRRPENGDDNSSSQRVVGRANSDHQTRRKGSRSDGNGPLRKPERAKSSNRGLRTSTRMRKSARDIPSKSSRSARSIDDSTQGDAPLKAEQSYSTRQGELNRYKVKRNKSMDSAQVMQARKNAVEVDSGHGRPPRRAESMMLSREMGRRGKANSLVDLVQYKEEEIHSTSYFASNHVLINRERMKRGLRPLTRNIAMDQLARASAETMAGSTGIQPLNMTYVGNVLRGDTIRSIHRSTMLQKQGRERANILNPYFQDFGVGTCKGEDGMLYMCQLFSERLQLALTDTVTGTAQDD